jgi:hypothetical protein
MSRLDSNIRRLKAQRDILNYLAEVDVIPPGVFVELGLGNGRTFDHIREKFPGCRIIAFDRAMGAHGDSLPQGDDLVLGEISQTGKAYYGMGAAMVHADIGTGYVDRDARTLMWLPEMVASMLMPGGIGVSGLPLEHAALQPMTLPDGVPQDRYFLYRRAD